MSSNVLSAWPDVDLDRLSTTELMTSISTIDVASASESLCLGAVIASKHLRRRLDADEALLLERACDLAARAQTVPQGATCDAIEGIESIAAEVSLALALTKGESIHRVGDSVAVYLHLPRLWKLMSEGRLDRRVAVSAYNQMFGCLTPGSPQWKAAEAGLAQVLEGKSHGSALAAVRRAIHQVDPLAAQERSRQAKQDRHVRAFPLADGMGGLSVKLSADVIRMIDGWLDALADAYRDHARRTGEPNPGNHQQRRADALTAVIKSTQTGVPIPFLAASQGDGQAAPIPFPAASTHDGRTAPVLAWWLPPALPTQQGRKPHLVVTISADTLRELNDAPGHLQGYGDIPADLAREIARQAGRVTLIPVQQPGRPSRTHGPGDQAHCPETTRVYKPRQTVIDQVLGRFQTCVHPSCTMPAGRCDIDHAVPFAKGGKSCPCNLVPLCRFHHRLKTHGGWSLRLTRPDEPYPVGTIEFRSRLGQRRIELPEPLPGTTPLEDDADPETRARLRDEAWLSELVRVDPRVRVMVGEPEAELGEPPF